MNLPTILILLFLLSSSPISASVTVTHVEAVEDRGYTVIDAGFVDASLRGRRMGTATVSPSFSQTLGIPSTSPTLYHTTLTETSPLHSDCYTASSPSPHDQRKKRTELTTFVMLNTNPDAIFIHDNVEVAVKAGNVVTFDGNIGHFTKINSGDVTILGPFGASSVESIANDGVAVEWHFGSVLGGYSGECSQPSYDPFGSVDFEQTTTKTKKKKKVRCGEI